MLGNSCSGTSKKWLIRSLLAAAVAMPVASANAALIQVDAVTTVPGVGTASSDSAPGANSSKFFETSTIYDINWQGNKQSISQVIGGGQTYNFIQPADDVRIRTNQNNTSSPNNQVIWYQGSVSGTNITLAGSRYDSLAAVLKSNDIYAGVDNLFVNRRGGNGDMVRTERLDVIFSNGITTSPSKAFAVFDRGETNAHDRFKIAAITSIDADGNPTGYGDLISVQKGWGQTSVLGSTMSNVVFRNSPGNSDLTSPAAIVPQPVGGILIPLSDLAGPGVTIYGYSLFAYDVTGTGAELLDWTKYSTTTNNNYGGLDLLGFTGLLDLNPIPEPAALSLLGLGALGLMRRRRAK